MMYTFLLIAVGIALAYVLYRFFPGAVERWFYRIQAARKTVFSLVYLMTTAALLVSGVFMLQLLGVAFVVLAVWFIVIEDPGSILPEAN